MNNPSLSNKKNIAQQLFHKLQLLQKAEGQDKAVTPCTFKPGEDIYKIGKNARGVFYLSCGLVKLIVPGDPGKDSMVRLIEHSEFFGMLSLIKDYKYARTAIAISEVEAFRINREFFIEALQKESELGYLFSMYALEVVYSNELKLTELIVKKVEQRLANILIAHANRTGDELIVTLSKMDLAMMSGTIQETISRKLATFVAKGYITLIGKKIILTDIEGLSKLSL